jgi:hypothetical protein
MLLSLSESVLVDFILSIGCVFLLLYMSNNFLLVSDIMITTLLWAYGFLSSFQECSVPAGSKFT